MISIREGKGNGKGLEIAPAPDVQVRANHPPPSSEQLGRPGVTLTFGENTYMQMKSERAKIRASWQ